MATREEAAQAVLDAIHTIATAAPDDHRSVEAPKAKAEAVKALTEAWVTLRVRGGGGASAG